MKGFFYSDKSKKKKSRQTGGKSVRTINFKPQIITPELQKYINRVYILKTDGGVNKTLQNILQMKDCLFSFDYETTGLKPHAEGHRIVCVSFCISKDASYVFEMTESRKRIWKRVLTSKRIKKSAHGIKFEHSWTRNILGYDIVNWHLCTMLGAHVLDSSQHVGLKYHVKKHFGIDDYSSHIEKYLKSTIKSSNGFNRIDECPIKDLLIYCGLDSLFQFMLVRIQRRKLCI